MGTNYYAEVEQETCNASVGDRCTERLHIGKSSFGWPFLFRGYEHLHLMTASQWFGFLLSVPYIVDEYGKRVDLSDFWSRVEQKKHDTTGLHCYGYWNDRHCRYDEHGYRFSDTEFS